MFGNWSFVLFSVTLLFNIQSYEPNIFGCFQLMTKEIPANTSDNVSEVNEQLKRTMEDLSSVMREKEEISQRCHELDTQVSAKNYKEFMVQ